MKNEFKIYDYKIIRGLEHLSKLEENERDGWIAIIEKMCNVKIVIE